jgi:hypothetical protein
MLVILSILSLSIIFIIVSICVLHLSYFDFLFTTLCTGAVGGGNLSKERKTDLLFT